MFPSHDRQARINRQQAEHGMGLQYDLWNKTNVGAQRKHMEDAGLNVGLMYGGSGGSGTASAGGTQGVGVPRGEEQNPFDINNRRMQEKQMDLLEAQTNKTNAEAENVAGVDRELKATSIKDIVQGIKNKEAQEKLIKADERFKTVTTDIAEAKGDYEVMGELYSAMKTFGEMERIAIDNGVEKATINENIGLKKQELIGAVLDNGLKSYQIDLTKAQIDEVKKKIWKMQV